MNESKIQTKLLTNCDELRLEDFTFRSHKFGPFLEKGVPTSQYELSVDRESFIQKVTPQVEFMMKEFSELTLSDCNDTMLKKLEKLGFPGIEVLMEDPQLCGEFISWFVSKEVIALLKGSGVAPNNNFKKVIQSFDAIRLEGDRVIITCQVYDRVLP